MQSISYYLAGLPPAPAAVVQQTGNVGGVSGHRSGHLRMFSEVSMPLMMGYGFTGPVGGP